ncbi:MAG: glycoside hydrolase family 130 protein [Kiritimatiellae bacterium]|nr:glycoside hydrolase family 130 protein [Kiritimatiellia bacterium]
MSVTVHRTNVRLNPDRARVLVRPFLPYFSDQNRNVIARIMGMGKREIASELSRVRRAFASRHLELDHVFARHYERVRRFCLTDIEPSPDRKLLIGAFFTSEYAMESAALCNPSIVPHPDQTGLPAGALRFVLSLRAVGEGHISSITFREGVLHADRSITIEEPSPLVVASEPQGNMQMEKHVYEGKLIEMGIDNEFSDAVLAALPDPFTARDAQTAVQDVRERAPRLGSTYPYARDTMLWLAMATYRTEFPAHVPLAARCIHPHSPSEKQGIEDARFVRFQGDGGDVLYYATYTAWNGRTVLPQLLQTRDFRQFTITTFGGKAVRDKGMALFPSRIGGRYAMLSRHDGENLHLMYSDSIEMWHESVPVLRPSHPWEFVKVGNCGSPMRTDAGWLVITHGVGPVRRYSLGAALLDRADPSKVIGRLGEPLLRPRENEREGYVPNVVYSCGSLIHNGTLVLPYAMADYATRIALVDLDELLGALHGA